MGLASTEIRTRAAAAYNSGEYTQRELGKAYGCSQGSIGNWVHQYRDENRLSPLPRGHKRRSFTGEEEALLAAFVKENPDATLAEIKAYFQKECALSTICTTLKRIGFVLKKKRYTPAKETGQMLFKNEKNGRNHKSKQILKM